MSIKTAWNFVTHVATDYGRDNCGQLAAAISYFVLFSIVPFTLVVVSLFGMVAGGRQLQEQVTPAVVDFLGLRQGDALIAVDSSRVDDRLGAGSANRVRAAIAAMTPEQREALAENVIEALREQTFDVGGLMLTAADLSVRYDNGVSNALQDVSSLGAPFTVAGALVMVWSATTMFGAVRRAINAVWRVERQKPYFQQKAQDLVMAATVGVFLFLSVGGTALLRALRELSDDALGPLSTETGIVWDALPYVLPFLISVPVFALTYRFVPASRVTFRQTLLGALVAALMFEVLKNAFAFYVANFRAYDLVYGSLGGILLFLTSVYFSAAILLIGAEITASYPLLAAGQFDPVVDPDAPRRRWIVKASRDVAIFLRGLFWQPRGQSKQGNPPSVRQR